MALYWLVLGLVTVLPVISALESVAYILREETTTGTEIGNIKTDAALSDQFTDENYQRLVFSILNPANDDAMSVDYFFEVEESTGVLKVLRPLDRDHLDICAFMRHCVLTFDVAVGPEDIFHVISVRVEVEDINDNSPVFGLSELSLNISELDGPGTSYQLPVVTDQDGDSYGVSKMSISPDTGQFSVRWMRGSDGKVQPRLELLQSVDREQVTKFDLTITASDGGSPPLSAILLIHADVLDTNDNIPQFEESGYEVNVPEDEARGRILIKVKATDPDHGHNGEVVYKMSASTTEQYGDLFSISAMTGIITLTGSLDRETYDVYYLTVVAADRGEDGRESSATVTVYVDDKNDNAPVIRISTLTDSGLAHVAEDADVDTFVALLSVKDQDWGRNADITCTLNTGDFRLEALQKNKFKIVTGVILDWERMASYSIEVSCHDHGVPQKSSTAMVTVEVDDVNDHTPVFESDDVTMHVTENSRPGTVIGEILASDEDHDENGRVTYSTTDIFNTYVSVDEDTGIISTITSLDREAIDKLIIYVIACDHGNPPRSATATVTVLIDDVNDMVPVFTQASYTFVVTENENSRRELSRLVATDRDNAPYNVIRYSLRGPNAYFLEMNPENGTLFAVKPLDREIMPYIEVQAVATDEQNPAFIGLANVTVYVSDVNDQVPRIIYPSPSNNTIEISSQLETHDTVGWIQALDGDSGQNAVLEYFLTFPRRDRDDLFTVDIETGQITVLGDLSNIDNDVIHCVVVVKDGGIPSLVVSANFTIIINSTLDILVTSTDDDGQNITIIIVVIAATLVLVALLVGAIVFVFRRTQMRRSEKKPRYTVEKMGSMVAHNGQLDLEKPHSGCDKKPIMKIYDPKTSQEMDKNSLGSEEGSTTDSGRGASEEGEHGEHNRSVGSRHNESSEANTSPSSFPATDESVITEQFDLSSSCNHNSTSTQRNSKHKNVTFEDNVMMAEIPHESPQSRKNFTVHDHQNGYSAPYDSCPAISYPSDESPLYNSPRSSSNNSSNSHPSSYKDLSPSPWSPDSATDYSIPRRTGEPRTDYSVTVPQSTPRRTGEPRTDYSVTVPQSTPRRTGEPATDYSVTVPQSTPRRTGEPGTDYSANVPQSVPRRTVRDVKAKDRSKRLDSLAAMHANVQTMQSDPDLCQNYDSNRPYDFTDSNSLLKYKMHGTDDSTSELNSAASTTSGTYIIQTGELQCDCNHGN